MDHSENPTGETARRVEEEERARALVSRRWTLHGLAFRDGSWQYTVEGPRVSESFTRTVVPEEDMMIVLEAIDEIYNNSPTICSKLHVAHMEPGMLVTPGGRGVNCPVCCPNLRELVDAHLHERKKAYRRIDGYKEAITKLRRRCEGKVVFREVIEFFEEIDLIEEAGE